MDFANINTDKKKNIIPKLYSSRRWKGMIFWEIGF